MAGVSLGHKGGVSVQRGGEFMWVLHLCPLDEIMDTEISSFVHVIDISLSGCLCVGDRGRGSPLLRHIGLRERRGGCAGREGRGLLLLLCAELGGRLGQAPIAVNRGVSMVQASSALVSGTLPRGRGRG